MGEKVINLEEVMKISETEFKKHISAWLLDKNLSRNLQAKLRKNIIENFGNTRLGKKINAKYNTKQKLFISPLHLVLHTLVAEFLYAENCHYTLSVFCSETPNQITLPNFENKIDFRFPKEDIVEILEAIANENLSGDLKKNVLEKYLKVNSRDKLAPSCLYVIFETIFKTKLKKNVLENNESISKNRLNNVTYSKGNFSKLYKRRTLNPNRKMYIKNFRFLKKYLVLLADKMKDIFILMNKLQNKNRISSNIKDDIVPGMKQLSKKLDKISRLLSKQNKNRISSLLLSINHISKQIKTCFDYFNKILQKTPEPRSVPQVAEKNFNDWISEIKNTKSGKEFLVKVESSIKKVLTKEKRRMLDKFARKLENEQKWLKLKYKQQYLNKINTLENKSEIFKSSPKYVKNETVPLERHNDLTKSSVGKIHDKHSYTNNHSLKYINKNEQLLKEEKTNSIPAEENFLLEQPIKICETRNKVQQEKHFYNIIHEAKLKIEELENESSKIDEAFKEHLLKKQQYKIKSKQDIDLIWDKYKLEQTILSKKCKILQNKQKKPNVELPTMPKDAGIFLHTTEEDGYEQESINNSCRNGEDKNNITENISFDNPFKDFQHVPMKTYLQQLKRFTEKNEFLEIIPIEIKTFDNKNKTTLDKSSLNSPESTPKSKKADLLFSNIGKISTVYNDSNLKITSTSKGNFPDVLSEKSAGRVKEVQSYEESIKSLDNDSAHLKNIFQISSFSEDKEINKRFRSSPKSAKNTEK